MKPYLLVFLFLLTALFVTFPLVHADSLDVSSAEIRLGDRFLVRGDGLSGTEVCEVRLGDTRLVFLDDAQTKIRAENDCPKVLPGGTFVAAVGVVNKDGNINDRLITKFINSSGQEELVIRDNSGKKFSIMVKIAKPTLTIYPEDGKVNPGDYLVFRGTNFPVDQKYYEPVTIVISVNKRTVARFYSIDGMWEFDYRIPLRSQRGRNTRPLIKINDYELPSLTEDFYIKVNPPDITVTPDTVKIGQPVKVTVSGLDGFTHGYFIKIDSGPFLSFGDDIYFATDREGQFSYITIIPEDYHRDFMRELNYNLILRVKKAGEDLYYVAAIVNLSQEVYTAPTPTPKYPEYPITQPSTETKLPPCRFGFYLLLGGFAGYRCF